MCDTFRRKLHGHETNALIDALAILETIQEAKDQVQDGTIDTLKAMCGIKGNIPKHINNAIEEQTNNKKDGK